jgi:HSP20 family molecular chaperone IbpA
MARIEQSIDVNVPLRAVYNQMTQFTDFPRFMEGVQEIRQLDDTHLHWHSKSRGRDSEWDSEITEQVPDQCIAWRNISGKKNVGRVVFQPIADDKTRVTLSMECDPEGSSPEVREVENIIAKHTEEDLARFKKFIESQGHETGEWRGEVHNAQVMNPDDSRQDRSEQRNRPDPQPLSVQDRDAPSMSQQPGMGARSDQPPPEQKTDQQSTRQTDQQSDRQARAQSDTQSDTQSGAQQNGTESWLPRLMEVWEEPLVVMRRMSQEMDNLVDRFIGRPGGLPLFSQGANRNWIPPVEVSRRDNQLVIYVDLPGIKQEDVQIEIKGDKLTIEGDRRMQAGSADQEYRRTERPYGHFYRIVPLPEGVDPDAAIASMHDGVLEITLPVTPPSRQARRIDIQSTR